MRSAVSRLIFKAVFFICYFLISGCAQMVPVYDRTYVNGVIKEEIVGSYKDQKIPEIKLSRKGVSSLANPSYKIKFIKIVEFFERSPPYRQERSKIDRLVWDFHNESIRIQLKNCRYFVLIEADVNNYFKVLESGVVGPCS